MHRPLHVTVWIGAMIAIGIGTLPAKPVSAHSGVISPSVALLRVPDRGIQPQAIVDSQGVLHLVYFQGDPAHGDLFYVRKKLGSDIPFSTPIRVNSHPRSAIAIGTIRGAQLAIGKGDTVHVVWNGSDQAPEGRDGAAPMLYSRLNKTGTAFEAERNLIIGSEVIDGGGSVAADPKNNRLYVLWHGTPKGGEEAAGSVYLARSTDGGATFRPTQRVSVPVVGTCGCCGMRAITDSTGTLYVLYRAATRNVDRDTILLTSRDGGTTFQQISLQPWRADVCPMSLFGLASVSGRAGVVGAWETKGRVYITSLHSGTTAMSSQIASAPGSVSGDQKYPVVTIGTGGKKLLAWAEGTGWQRGGSLVWQVYDANGKPMADPGRVAGGVPTWSLPAAVTRPDGTFVIIY